MRRRSGVKHTYGFLLEFVRYLGVKGAKDWQRMHWPSWDYAHKRGWDTKIRKALGLRPSYLDYTYAKVKDIAKQFDSLTEWNTKHYSSYYWAYINKVQRLIAKELGWEIRYPERVSQPYTYETVRDIASKFSRLSEWEAGHQSSYIWAIRNKKQREIGKELGWVMQKWGTNEARGNLQKQKDGQKASVDVQTQDVRIVLPGTTR